MKLIRFLFGKRWSSWKDITTFSYGGTGYVLQGRRHLRNNRVRFYVTKIGSRYNSQNTMMSLEGLQTKLKEV